MTDLDIHNFHYFVEEIGKNLKEMKTFLEKESKCLQCMNISYDVMSQMCENWKNKLENQ